MIKGKIFGKRSLSLFMAVMMCLSLVNFTVFATDGHVHNEDGWVCTQGESVTTLTCDKHVHNADCYTTERGGLTCAAEEHQHGEGCYKAAEPVLDCIEAEHTHGEDCYDENDELTCTEVEHTHGEGCYTAGEPVLDCEKTEHTHGDGCYATVTVKVCEEEDHEHGTECYTQIPGEWECVPPAGGEDAVQAFLDAVNAIEVPEEDLVLEENAELAESFAAEIWAANDLFEALTEEEQELEKVQIAMMELENMLTVLPDYGASAYALSNVVVAPEYNPGSCVPGVNRFGGSIAKTVGEEGFYRRRAIHDFYCPTCGWFFGRSDAKEYVNFEVVGTNLDVISNISYEVGNLQGYPCLQMNFTGAKAGTAQVTLRYDVNFHTRWNSSYAACPSCRTMTGVNQYDDNWYHYEDTFYVTVTGTEQTVTGDTHWVYVPANAASDEIAVVELVNYKSGEYNEMWDTYQGRYTPTISDPNGINGKYASLTVGYNTTTSSTDRYGTVYYGVLVSITGQSATSEDGPATFYVKYKKCTGTNRYTEYIDKFNVVVYDPNTITLKKNDTVNLSYRNYHGNAATFEYELFPKATNVLQVVAAGSSVADGYNVTAKSVTKDTKSVAKYSYFDSSKNNVTCCVDVTHFVVPETPATTTPVTIVKEFDGLTEDQIPDNFTLSYTVTGCDEHGNVTGTLTREGAKVVNTNGTPALVWDVELPVVKHGTATHTITFTEQNVSVTGFKNPTFLGNMVTLESLSVEDGAKAAVITLTNRYEPDETMYVLSYDGMGGTGCPATQYTSIGNTISHSFNVKGGETEIKVPTHPQGYEFLGWSETDTNQKVKYAYDSETGAYDPATITLYSTDPSKTLYAVWKERPHVEPNPKLTKLEKVRVTDETQAPAGTPDNVEYDAVIFRSDDQKVTLLYKLTVTGTAGAAYKVTDEGAEWVSGGDNHSKDGNTLVITGTIAKDATTAVIYVTKEFDAKAIKDGMLTNTAELESNGTTENPTDGPSGDNGKDGDDSNASEQRKVTVNFKTDGGETLQDSTSKDYDKGGAFGGISVPDKPTTRRAAPRATSETIVIPWTIVKDGNTYVLDEVASADALKRLGELQTVTQDVVEDIIYSLDEKGTIGTDDEGEPTDTSDGIPDKYQAKVVYTATEGGTQNGVTTYVTIMDEGKMATEGTISIAGATAEPSDNYHFVNWTAAATNHDGWNYAASTAATLDPDNISAKGGAVYTFTANFERENNPDPEQVTLTLSYDANGGSNAPAPDSQTVNQGASATFTVKGQESMTREGYTFQGWATSANGAVAYRAGNSISIRENTTLYAVWSSNSIVIPDPDPVTRYTLTINYVYEDGTTAAPTHSSSHNSGYQYSVSSPSIEGYTPDQAVVSGTLTSNVTVTVVYTADGANIEDENPPLAELPDEDPGVNIPDENPPLAELPDEDPGVDIPDEEPPLAENPEVDIPDEDVPLDATPKTGDDSHTGLWATLCVVSLLGAVALGRKEEDERA